MAMIKCPECGQEISSMARACPHCGCRVTVCPDCGAVYMGERETCESCGCVLKQAESAAPSEASKGQALQKSVARFQIVDTLINTVCVLLFCAAFLVVCFALPNMIKAITKGGLELAEMDHKIGNVRNVLILCCTLLAAYSGECLYSVIAQHVFGTHMRGARAAYKKIVFDENAKTSVNFLCAVEFAERPKKAMARYVLAALKLAFELTGAVLLCVWAVNTVQAFYAEWFLALDPSTVKMKWDFLDVSFILGCIFVVAGEAVGFVHKRRSGSDKHLIEIQETLKNQPHAFTDDLK